jgi:hypothetical protein
MALVEIVASNLHAGANLRKLEVGSVVDVDDATAERWINTGKAKEPTRRKARSCSKWLPVSTQADRLTCKSNSPTHWSRTKS